MKSRTVIFGVTCVMLAANAPDASACRWLRYRHCAPAHLIRHHVVELAPAAQSPLPATQKLAKQPSLDLPKVELLDADALLSKPLTVEEILRRKGISNPGSVKSSYRPTRNSREHLRTWSDHSGRRIVAQLLAFDGNTVTIYRPKTGKRYEVPITRFCKADQLWLLAQHTEHPSPRVGWLTPTLRLVAPVIFTIL